MQIYAVGRQALSLVAGGAIDVFLLGQLRLLRQEHTIARAIHAIQAALWPGGTWFMYRPERKKPPVRWLPCLQAAAQASGGLQHSAGGLCCSAHGSLHSCHVVR